jgi:hypothetical protein
MLSAGEKAIVPIGPPYEISAGGPSIVLRGWVPDLILDVIAPLQAAGGPPEMIHQLGVEPKSS